MVILREREMACFSVSVGLVAALILPMAALLTDFAGEKNMDMCEVERRDQLRAHRKGRDRARRAAAHPRGDVERRGRGGLSSAQLGPLRRGRPDRRRLPRLRGLRPALLVMRVKATMPFRMPIWNGLCHSKLMFGMALQFKSLLWYNLTHGRENQENVHAYLFESFFE